MKTSWFFLKIFLPLFFLSFTIRTQGQISGNLKDDLQKISDTLYKNHNWNFLIVDAIIDGKIKLNVPYELDYDSDKVSFNGKALPKRLNKRYVEKIRSFSPGERGMSQNGPALSLRDIFGLVSKKSSNLYLMNAMQKKQEIQSQMQLANDRKFNDSLKKLLINDGLTAAKVNEVSLLYNKTGVFVNKKLLPAEVAEKYIKLLHSHGTVLKDAKDEYYVEYKK